MLGNRSALAASLLHRHIWQRLPRSWRREALFGGAALVAPRPTSQAKPSTPLLVAGALRTMSGLGESARLCHDALAVAGRDVHGIDLAAALIQPVDCPEFNFVEGRAVDGPGTLILHVNGPLVPLAMLSLGRRVVRHKYVIGYWAWELPKVPSEWRFGVPFVHEIWVPSEFVAAAVRPIADGRPVHVVPHPVALGYPSVQRPPRVAGQPFTVLTIFNMASSFARKNPCATIQAFRMEFGDDSSVRLFVKTSHLSSFPRGVSLIKEAMGVAHNIVLVDKSLSADELNALYNEANVVMSLHRSEGFGLTIAEAMLRGLPVVATDWSGNVDFLSPETGIPIPYRLTPAEDPQGTYHHPDMAWAEPDVTAAASALRRLREDPALAARLGRNAAEFAQRAWSAENYAGAVKGLLGL